jgi:hypothetical protein
MNRPPAWCALSSGLALVVLTLTVGGCGSTSSSERAPAAAATSSPGEKGDGNPSLDLAAIAEYDVFLLASHRQPIGREKSRVEEIGPWSLNERGQVAFLVGKHTSDGHAAADLYLADGKTIVPLATQRRGGEHTLKRFSRIRGAWLNDAGDVLLYGYRKTRDDAGQLFSIAGGQVANCGFEAKQLPKVDMSRRGIRERDSWMFGDQPAVFFGPQRQLVFLAGDPQAGVPAAIHAGTADAAKPTLLAENDPSDPLRQFDDFWMVHGANARGQILFEARVGRVDAARLFLYTPTSDASAGDASPAVSVREIARPGGRLPGTKIELAKFRGHPIWRNLALSERGDVMMVADVDRRRASSDTTECLFVLRPDGQWRTIAQQGVRLGKSATLLEVFGSPTLNARGQIAFVSHFERAEEFGPYEVCLFRVEPDDAVTEIARVGQVLKSGDTLAYFHGDTTPGLPPLLLTGGRVVMEVTVKSPDEKEMEEYEFRSQARRASIAVFDDDSEAVEVLRLPDQLPKKSESDRIEIEEIQANDAGWLGVVYSTGSHVETLLLAKPK